MKMLHKALSTALIATFCLISTAQSQAAERIKFARNAVSKTVTGTLSGFNSQRVYIIGLQAGQRFDVQPVSGRHPITVSVIDPNGESIDDWGADCHSHHSSTTEYTGDYKIYVTECKKADPWKGTFTINVSALH